MPRPRANEPKEPPPPTVDELPLEPNDATILEAWMERYIEAKAEMGELELELKGDQKHPEQNPGLAAMIQGKMVEAGAGKVRHNGFRFSAQIGRVNVIQAQKLLELGVSPEIIKAATKTTEYAYLDCRVIKSRDQQEQ